MKIGPGPIIPNNLVAAAEQKHNLNSWEVVRSDWKSKDGRQGLRNELLISLSRVGLEEEASLTISTMCWRLDVGGGEKYFITFIFDHS